jgi:hypothetical protein
LLRWVTQVDDAIDRTQIGGLTLNFPREPANILVRIAMASKLEEHESQSVFVQVLDSFHEHILFWGVNRYV